MTFYVIAAAAFVLGVGLVAAGSRKPSLAERVDALRPVALRPAAPPRVYKLGAMEAARPGIERVGRLVARRLSLDTDELARRLALAGRHESVALFIGTKLVIAVAALGAVPVASATIAGYLPAWVAPLAAVAAWFAPDAALREQGKIRRSRLEEGLVAANLDIALRVAGGTGLSEAVQEAARGEGPFAQELRLALDQARLARRTPADAVEDLAGRTGLEDARDLASVLRAAEQGAPLAETLLTQARAIAERHRLQSLAAGQRAEVLMIVIQAALILPGSFVLIVWPVASRLVGIAGG